MVARGGLCIRIAHPSHNGCPDCRSVSQYPRPELCPSCHVIAQWQEFGRCNAAATLNSRRLIRGSVNNKQCDTNGSDVPALHEVLQQLFDRFPKDAFGSNDTAIHQC